MKPISEISKSDLIKVANLQGFENKKSNLAHLYLDKVGETCIENHLSGAMKLWPETVKFLESKYKIS